MNSKKIFFLLLSLSIALIAVGAVTYKNQIYSGALAQEGHVVPEVPYVPTPTEVVEEMLRVAKVGKNDVVYDLGCGDGRIVITAAQKYGARGVGVDINPERIKECNENAKKAGVTDRVKFIQGDLFQTNFSEATVVTLYLLPAVNLRLRPKLLSELKPGSRVVSHAFDMGDWAPNRIIKVQGNETERTVYYWVIPEKN